MKLKKCVNQKLNIEISQRVGKKEFDFYIFTKQFEEILLNKKLLKGIDKESYASLFNSIIIDKKDYKELYLEMNKLIDRVGFSSFSTEFIFNHCPYIVSQNLKDKEKSYVYKQGFILNKMMAQGFDEMNLITELFNITDKETFNKIVYRSSSILLIMINLDMKYNKRRWVKLKLK